MMSTDEVKDAVSRPEVKYRYKEIVAAEGDRHEFEQAGFQCALLRHLLSGHWCGYVLVEKENPLYGKEYGESLPFLQAALDTKLEQPLSEAEGLGVLLSCLTGCVEPTLDTVITVHGGVTFSSKPWWPENKDDLWAFGFDCAHYLDIQPYDSGFNLGDDPEAQYRDKAYVERECRRMAEQLRAITELAALEARND